MEAILEKHRQTTSLELDWPDDHDLETLNESSERLHQLSLKLVQMDSVLPVEVSHRQPRYSQKTMQNKTKLQTLLYCENKTGSISLQDCSLLSGFSG